MVKMSTCSKFYKLVICSRQPLASKIHNISNLRNKLNENFVILLISILLHGKVLHRLILLQICYKISQVIG